MISSAAAGVQYVHNLTPQTSTIPLSQGYIGEYVYSWGFFFISGHALKKCRDQTSISRTKARINIRFGCTDQCDPLIR